MRKLPLTALALSICALTGCEAVTAMHNTDTMKEDLAAMKQTTGGMAGTTNNMNGNMNELTRLAKVADGKADLDLSKHNYTEFLPPPAEILAGAKMVAENMTESELTDYLFVRIKEFNETTPDSNKQDSRLIGGYPYDYANAYNLEQMVRGVILQAIAGQIPQKMVEQMIQTQINNGGPRPDVVLQMLMLRAKFLDEFLIDKDAFRAKINTIGMARAANERVGYLKFIADLPFSDQIAFNISTTAFLPQINAPQIMMPPPFTTPRPEGDPNDPAFQKAMQDYNNALKGYTDQVQTYTAKCVSQSPADPGCLQTTSDFLGIATYNVKLDTSMDQRWWKKLDRAVEGYTDCKGKQHPGEIPDGLRGDSSPYAQELARIAEGAKKNYPPENCPAKQ